jgi:hypothetical protein
MLTFAEHLNRARAAKGKRRPDSNPANPAAWGTESMSPQDWAIFNQLCERLDCNDLGPWVVRLVKAGREGVRMTPLPYGCFCFESEGPEEAVADFWVAGGNIHVESYTEIGGPGGDFSDIEEALGCIARLLLPCIDMEPKRLAVMTLASAKPAGSA